MEEKSNCMTLNSGNLMPKIGLGTSRCTPEQIIPAVKHAIKCGYRHFDSAMFYSTKDAVASAITESIKEGIVRREDLFLTSKGWMQFQDPSEVRNGLIKTLGIFQTDYFDLYLIHFPIGLRKQVDIDPDSPFTDVDYVETWKAFIEVQKEGLVRDIGVSNFNEYQLNRLLNETSVVPAVNQIENHPYLTQENLVNFCQKNNIVVTAFSPLGAFGYIYKEVKYELLKDATLKEIASRLNKSPAQIVLRFQIQRNIIVIPKSINPNRIEENSQAISMYEKHTFTNDGLASLYLLILQTPVNAAAFAVMIFDFELSEDDMKTIASLNKDYRIADWDVPRVFNNHDIKQHKYYPHRLNYAE